jgi:hypothetical protein
MTNEQIPQVTHIIIDTTVNPEYYQMTNEQIPQVTHTNLEKIAVLVVRLYLELHRYRKAFLHQEQLVSLGILLRLFLLLFALSRQL